MHNLCTAPIRDLQPGHACEAFVTNVKGHVLAHVLVIAADDALRVYSMHKGLGAIVPHFDRYIIREDVQVRDASAEAGPWLVADPLAESLPGTAARVATLHEGLSVVDGVSLDQIEQRGITPLPYPLTEAIRITAGWPRGGVDFAEGALPQELSRDREAISFNKGCYLGQETVARLDALGHVNKQLVRLELDSVPSELPHALLVEGKQVGQLTSVAPRLDAAGYYGLAMVRREWVATAKELVP